jgi:putative oxidoreductase
MARLDGVGISDRRRQSLMDRLSRISHYASFAARIILGAIFIYAGFIKILDPSDFARAVSNYRILPDLLVNLFSLILPWIEVLAGLSLLLGIWVPGGSLIIGALLFVFTIALSMALMRGLDISCGCFSTSPDAQTITWSYLARDLILLTMTVIVFFQDAGTASLCRLFSRFSKSSKHLKLGD